MQAAPRTALLLSLAGALPFLLCAGMIASAPAGERHRYAQAMTAYSAVILAFLGGIHWGTALSIAESAPKSARSLFLLSIVPPLVCWAILVAEGDRLRIELAVVMFGAAWTIDALLALQKLIPRWFFRLRCIVTPVVVGCLAVVWLLL